MSTASVKSFEAIGRVREEVLKFSARAGDGLTEINGQVRRTLDWIAHDRPGYWKDRTRRAFDAVSEAKNALHRCLMYPINDEQPSCTEERAALKKAEAHYQWCLAKQERVHEWVRTLNHELEEYKGRVAKLRHLIEVDAPRGAAHLERLVVALEAYVNTAAPGQAVGPAAVQSGAPPSDPSPEPAPTPEGAP
ncbi:MAG: hypothetical protein ACRCT8_07675 [Lacipirellulaceae bacterium]